MEETGNPIDPPPTPRPARDAARRTWSFPASGSVLLITGGSQGARVLNEVVSAWIRGGLPDGLHVIWATGKGAFDGYAKHESSRVRVRPYLSPIAEAYAAADIAVTRAGALTLAELCAWGIPGILVPLPTAAADHQTANARALVSSGAARELPQRELNAERLDREVRSLVSDPKRLDTMTSAALARGRPDAAETIAKRVLALARSSSPRA